MIEFENVSKVYQTREHSVHALDQLSLRIPSGDYVALCGPSGCGKSTLLSLIGGLALPTNGQVTVNDVVVSAASSAQRAKFRATHLGYVFQMFHLLPFLNVTDNVLVATNDLDPAIKERALDLLKQLGLEERCRHRPSQLSAGERQRVALARALLNQPKILLADEPTGNLDPANADVVLNQISQFHEAGGTVVLVTHERQAAARAQKIIALKSGRLTNAHEQPV